MSKIKELLFLVEEEEDGGFVAKCLTESIYTQGDNLTEVRENIKDAVLCHFGEVEMPNIVRMHITKDEVLVL